MTNSDNPKYLLIINENGANNKVFSAPQQAAINRLREKNYLPIIIEEDHATDIVYSLLNKIHTTLSIIPIHRTVEIIGLMKNTERIACVGNTHFDTFNYSSGKDEVRKVVLKKHKIIGIEEGVLVIRWDKMIEYLDTN